MLTKKKSTPMKNHFHKKSCQILNIIYTKKELSKLLHEHKNKPANLDTLSKSELCTLYTEYIHSNNPSKRQNKNQIHEFTLALANEETCPYIGKMSTTRLRKLLNETFPNDQNKFKNLGKEQLCNIYLEHWLKSGELEKDYVKQYKHFNKATFEEKEKFVYLTYALATHFGQRFKTKHVDQWIVNASFKTNEDYLCKKIIEKLSMPWTLPKKALYFSTSLAALTLAVLNPVHAFTAALLGTAIWYNNHKTKKEMAKTYDESLVE
jgi:hypothetical protein